MTRCSAQYEERRMFDLLGNTAVATRRTVDKTPGVFWQERSKQCSRAVVFNTGYSAFREDVECFLLPVVPDGGQTG